MKFLVDAQLPLSLKHFFVDHGFDTIHTLELEQKNQTPDDRINEIAKNEERIVITKDTDFLQSHLLKRYPPKLLLVKTGNTSNSMLLEMFHRNIDTIIHLFEVHTLIELHKDVVVVHKDE